MQLDGTHIAVRERTTAEVFDLALLVLRRHLGSLLFWFSLPSVLLLGLNYLVLREELAWMSEREGGPRLAIFWILCLGYLQAPLATSLMTVYLARKMFQDDSSLWSVLRPVRDRWWQLLWYHGICRHWLLVLVLLSSHSVYDDPGSLVGWVVLLVFVSLILRTCYPYLNEVILLERNPWWPGGKVLSTYRRNEDLHRFSMDWTLRAALLAAVITPFGLWALIKLMSLGGAIFLSRLPQESFFLLASIYIAVAGLSIYFAVVRFLGYLDLRIRREGWEVEILLRSAAAEWQVRSKAR